jgi:hypothetical protein
MEERLRRMCNVNGCLPAKIRSTLNDYNQALYAKQAYDKVMFKNVDALAAVGNN